MAPLCYKRRLGCRFLETVLLVTSLLVLTEICFSIDFVCRSPKHWLCSTDVGSIRSMSVKENRLTILTCTQFCNIFSYERSTRGQFFMTCFPHEGWCFFNAQGLWRTPSKNSHRGNCFHSFSSKDCICLQNPIPSILLQDGLKNLQYVLLPT